MENTDYEIAVGIQKQDKYAIDALYQRYKILIGASTRGLKLTEQSLDISLVKELWASFVLWLQRSDLDHLAKYSTPDNWKAHHCIEHFIQSVLREARIIHFNKKIDYKEAVRKVLLNRNETNKIAIKKQKAKHSALNKYAREKRVIEFDFFGNSCI